MVDPQQGGQPGCRAARSWSPPPDDAALDERALAGMGSGARGIFITFEGLDGSGKSTQMELLADALRDRGHDVVTTREPGGTGLGEAVRTILLDPEQHGMTPRTEALLYSAARAQLVETVIKPALDAGRIVLCDRYLDSSLAYQAYGRGLQVEDVLTLNIWATECLFPDLTLVLVADEQQRVGRVTGVTGVTDRLESEETSFFERAAEGYRRLASDHRHRIRLIESAGSVDDVQERLRAVVEEDLGLFPAL